MEANEIIALWKSYDRKLDENLSLNRRNAIDITKIKVRSFLSSMKPIKIFTLLTGILWVVFVDFIIIKAWPGANVFFLGSAMIQVLLTKFAIGVYLYQLYQIYQSGIDEPVVATQSRLASLQSSTILVTRILFLQLPVWTTFFWSDRLFENGNDSWVAVNMIITGVFLAAALWMFFNLKMENRDKKWFRLIFSGKEWDPLVKSMDLLDQVKEYR